MGCTASSSLPAHVAASTKPYRPATNSQQKHLIHLLQEGIMTIQNTCQTDQTCFLCENLPSFSMSSVQLPLMPPMTKQRKLPLYCCASCQSGFESTVLHVDDEDTARGEIAAHLRNLAKRSTEYKIRLTDVVLHLAVSSCGKDYNECAICSDDCQFSLVLPCGHSFHKSCIRQWFDNSRSCPVCRTEVPLTTLNPLSAVELMNCYTERELATKLAMLLFYTAVDDGDVARMYALSQSTEHHRIRATTLCSECTTDASVLDPVDTRNRSLSTAEPVPSHRCYPSIAVIYPADNLHLSAAELHEAERFFEPPEITEVPEVPKAPEVPGVTEVPQEPEPEDVENKRILAGRVEYITGSRIYGIEKTTIFTFIPPPPPLPYPFPIDIDQTNRTALVTVDLATQSYIIKLNGVQYKISCY